MGTLARAAQDPSEFHLKRGDRVVFYGDSITAQRLYTTFVETYVVTRFPELDVWFVNSGWDGDLVSGGEGGPIDVRLERDVFAHKPTILTVMLGMNDAAYLPFKESPFQRYRDGYERIVDSVTKNLPAIRLTLIQPSPYDEVTRPLPFPGGYNSVLLRYGQFVKELADHKQLAPVADFNRVVVAALERAKLSKLALSREIVPDRVHPAASGHLLMAGELLKTWRAPATVTSVEIDAATRMVTRSVNSKVAELEGSNDLRWVQIDAALPMPVDLSDAVMRLAVNCSDFLQSLNQQILKVTGLREGCYSLRIDGSEVGRFFKEQLSAGINLAVIPTPMFEQAQRVHELTLQHNDVHFARWRQVQLGPPRADPAARRAVLDALDWLEKDIVRQQRAAARPAPRQFALSRKRQTSDFDDDGNPDILLLGTDRTLAFWLMNGTDVRTGLEPYPLPDGWRILGTGDFNKDGKTDVLLQHRDRSLGFWLMDGVSIFQGLVPMSLTEGWEVAVTGDFNNDDQTDLLLQHGDGSLAWWLMDGVTVAQVAQVAPTPFKLPEDGRIVGAGDFDRDGTTDLLVFRSDRSLGFWLTKAIGIRESSMRLSLPEGWQLIGVGDFNRDGQADLMLRHTDRRIAFWFMDGMDIVSGEVCLQEPDGWEIVGQVSSVPRP